MVYLGRTVECLMGNQASANTAGAFVCLQQVYYALSSCWIGGQLPILFLSQFSVCLWILSSCKLFTLLNHIFLVSACCSSYWNTLKTDSVISALDVLSSRLCFSMFSRMEGKWGNIQYGSPIKKHMMPLQMF